MGYLSLPYPVLFQKESISVDAKMMRLDTWAHHTWPWIPYGSIQKAIRKGEIRLDQQKVSPYARLESYNDVYFKPRWLALFAQPEPAQELNTVWQNRIDQWVVYEDEHLVAFNKPQGVASQGGSGQTIHMDGLIQSWRPAETIRLVHRLDIQTSGVLLMAKTLACAQALARAFHDHQVKKIYWAIVHGHIPAKGTISQSLERDGHKMIISSSPTALSARTVFQPKALGYDAKGYPLTWVELFPKTGRMHQLRAHMHWLGHPIWGDHLYTPEKHTDKGMLALHCHHMAWSYKDTPYSISAPPPALFLKHTASWDRV